MKLKKTTNKDNKTEMLAIRISQKQKDFIEQHNITSDEVRTMITGEQFINLLRSK